MRNRLYFGHPINIYDTDTELQLLNQIRKAFPDWDIENPNQRQHQEGYKSWKESGGNGMDYFFKMVLPSCRAGIFLPFRDGAWGAGVFGEAQFLSGQGCPIYQITNDGCVSQIDLTEVSALSIEETRSRIRYPSGKIKPY